MRTCKPSCISDIPNNDWTKLCNLTYRTGGIPYVTFISCDPDQEFPNPGGPDGDDPDGNPWENLDNVRWAICEGILHVSGALLGQKPKGTFNKRRLSSCGPEQTISGTQTLTFQDYNADTVDLKDFDFWNGIDDNKNFLTVGWITCDELWYMTDNDWDLEIGDVIEDTKDGMNYKDGVISISEKALIKPISVPGIIDVLKSYLISENCYS